MAAQHGGLLLRLAAFDVAKGGTDLLSPIFIELSSAMTLLRNAVYRGGLGPCIAGVE